MLLSGEIQPVICVKQSRCGGIRLHHQILINVEETAGRSPDTETPEDQSHQKISDATRPEPPEDQSHQKTRAARRPEPPEDQKHQKTSDATRPEPPEDQSHQTRDQGRQAGLADVGCSSVVFKQIPGSLVNV
ncbi:uncharacterized protein V6R79_001724 [Siganus canaliculatus]